MMTDGSSYMDGVEYTSGEYTSDITQQLERTKKVFQCLYNENLELKKKLAASQIKLHKLKRNSKFFKKLFRTEKSKKIFKKLFRTKKGKKIFEKYEQSEENSATSLDENVELKNEINEYFKRNSELQEKFEESEKNRAASLSENITLQNEIEDYSNKNSKARRI